MLLAFQKIFIGFTVVLLIVVIVVPAYHILNHSQGQDLTVQMYVSMFPELASNNPEAMVDSFIVLPDGSLTLLAAKNVVVRGYLIGNTARIIYLGGKDDAELTSLNIQLRNSGELVLHQLLPKPTINQQYTFPNVGGANGPDEIIVIGNFKDTSQQILLTASI
jgi:hypothetical protein